MPERDAVFRPQFRDDLIVLIRTHPRRAIRLLQLVEAVCRDPFSGIGKPEPLRYVNSNTWARRLSDADRVVYEVRDTQLIFLQARFHYSE